MKELVDKAKELFRDGTVGLIIGYSATLNTRRLRPIFVRNEQEAEKLTFNHFALNNLAVYLTAIDKPKNGKIGIVVKGCDTRSVVALMQESQIKRDDVYIIGVACNGVAHDYLLEWNKDNVAGKCVNCKMRTPHVADVLIGHEEEFEKPDDKYGKLIAELEAKSPKERFTFWEQEFEKCIRCYACRQACPNCYCEQCIVDKSTPRWIESSISAGSNFSWNVIRAFHQAGRCTGCGECERACPMDIPLTLLNRKLGMVAMKEFSYRHGMAVDEPTLVGNFKTTDKEDFIE